MLSLEELHEEFYDEIGGVDGDLARFVEDADITRWLNHGQRRLGWLLESSGTVTWSAGDTEAAFPSDCFKPGKFIVATGTVMPSYRLWNDGFFFLHPDGAGSDGSVTLLYHARPAAITGSQDSELTEEGDQAIVAYALYRFFKKMATTRSDYEQYATLTGGNGIDVEALLAQADRCYDEFLAAEQSLPVPEASTFYGD